MVFRRRRPAAKEDSLAVVDPAALPREYRATVNQAAAARVQFQDLVAATREGPLRTRLTELGERIDAGVLAVWRTASQAARIDGVAATLDPDRVLAELKQARRAGADEALQEALQARFASTQQLLNARDELKEQLPVLEARLGTAVARAATLTLVDTDAFDAELTSLTADLDGLVMELDALCAATTELRSIAP
jgi:hypothetical protein